MKPQPGAPALNGGGLLDRVLPRPWRMLIITAAALMPACLVLKHFDPESGFTRLILFGADRHDSALGEVRALNPVLSFPAGYDGQFYAQLAIDPFLQEPALNQALDNPPYRARRIFLPILAFLAGAGRPALIIQIYALLNLAFWYALQCGMTRHLKPCTLRDYLCCGAVLFSTGAVFSIERALTDLPAAVFGFYAAAWTGAAAAGAIGLAIFSKETSLLFLVRMGWPPPAGLRAWLRLALQVSLVLAPFVLWLCYVHHMLGVQPGGFPSMGWPLQGWPAYVVSQWTVLQNTEFALATKHSSMWEWRFFEFLAPLSGMAQAVSFALWPRVNCAYWRMGVGFAALFLCLTPEAGSQIGFCRIVLPMTIAFNIGLLRQRGSVFAIMFIAGNAGMAWGFCEMLRYLIWNWS